MDTTFEHKVRQRAYEIWMASGMGEGDAERHWLHAERVVRNEAEMPTAPGGNKAAKNAVAGSTKAKAVIAKTVIAKVAKTKSTASKVGKAKTGGAKIEGVETAAPRRVKTVSAEARA